MISAAAVHTLAAGLHGLLIAPDDAGYDGARRVWNGLIDRRPALIAQCADADDVVRAVRFAAEHELSVAIRGGGHNVAGFGTCDGGLVVDLSRMAAVSVDAAARTARAQGGLSWGPVDRATIAAGLATTGGLVSTTGIGGLTLGGGIGWLMRKHGLTIDNLLAADLVTADGTRVTASAASNPDLFWGLRGGGGNFGVVTEFTYRLHPQDPMVFGGAMFFPAARAGEVLRAYAAWVRTLPDELTSLAVFLTAPPEPFMPPAVVGTPVIAVALCHSGSAEDGVRLVQPLRTLGPVVDVVGPIPYLALQSMFDAGAPKGILSYWKTEYLGALGDRTIDTLVEHAGRMRAPFAQVHVHHVEGAVGRVPPDATAMGRRDAPFVLNVIGMWQDPAETDAQIKWVRVLADAVRPLGMGGQYLNFMGEESDERVRAAYGPEKYARLVELKRRYDPGNLFRHNQNIVP